LPKRARFVEPSAPTLNWARGRPSLSSSAKPKALSFPTLSPARAPSLPTSRRPGELSGSIHAAHHLADLIPEADELLEVGTENAEEEVRWSAAEALVDPHAERRREERRHAGHLLQLLAHCVRQLIKRRARSPSPLGRDAVCRMRIARQSACSIAPRRDRLLAVLDAMPGTVRR